MHATAIGLFIRKNLGKLLDRRIEDTLLVVIVNELNWI